ncbi:MAG: DNA translocase FtsK 4TM domain-containing protein, partial [Planctomycetota bacterium]
MATKNTRAARSTKRSNNESADGNGLWPRLAWLATAAAWTFVVASLASFDPADSPTHAVYPPNEVTSNLCGPIGAAIAYQGYALLGWAAWLPMAVVAWVLILPVLNRPTGSYAFRGLGTVLLTAAGCGSLALMFATSGPLPELAGGKLGYVFAGTLVESFGRFGSFLWLLLAAAIGLVVGFDRLALGLPMAVYRGIARTLAKPTGKKPAKKSKADPGVAAGAVGGLLAGVAAFFAKLAGAGKSKPAKKKRRRAHDLDGRPTTPVEAGDAEAEDEYEDEQAEWDEAAEADDEEWEYEDEEDGEYEYEEEDEAADEAAEVVAGADDDEEEEDELPGAPQILAEDQLRDKMAKLPVRFAGATRKLATEEDLRDLQVQAELKGYRYPGIDILEDPEEDFSASLEAIVREQATNLESALQEYRIKGEVVGIESGPVITQFDVRLAPGTKVSKLQAVSTDIARSLRAVNVRIVGNQAGRDTVGVEVPNPKKEKVRLKELMADRERFADMKLPMFLGKDAAGDPLIEDLTKMPHMLIAGTTGSGKSVCMNTIIMSWLYTKKPNELKMVLVDPKMVEMSQFKDIPHLMCPVITEMAKAAAILEWACKKMDERYELLADAGCRDISSYNELDFDEICERMGIENEQDRARVPQRLPYMVFIIDELADLMMTNKEVEGSIIRIAQK